MSNLAIRGGTPLRNDPWPTWPPYTEREREFLNLVLDSRNWGGYPSPNFQARHFAEEYAKYAGAKYGICAANGTVTLEIALRALGIAAGDEVIVPATSWVATAACAVYLNAVPVFVDIKPMNFTIDCDLIEAAITPKTRAIIAVHLGSTIADLDRLTEIAKKHGLALIEDCAHMHGGEWRGRGVGSIGDLGSFSFQSSKLMTAGEGGLILTSDPVLEQKCQSLVNCGRKEPGYDEFDGRLFGWNYRISEFQAAVLRAQLEALPERTKLRAENGAYLTEQLRKIPGIGVIERDPRITTQAHYQFIFTYDKNEFAGVHRDKFIEACEAEGLHLDGAFYKPMYANSLFAAKTGEWPMLRERYGDGITKESANTPVAWEFALETGVWMHYPKLMGTKKDVDDIVAIIRKVRENATELR
ncbi:MAG: DegT/DnrJ/EryC1/StrS family aminotransferase [Deltaproteobacteria bacterium]|nr:DegT/DnrJ/EryC1/StrS family aminotransferase [Deltaproteobacteria bacterium]